MTDRLPYLPLWTDDYLTDTRHLTTVQHGAYLLLLFTAWRLPGCRLPDDDKLLARWAGLNRSAWLHHRPTIMAMWDLEDGHWVQKRLARERNYCEALSKKKSEANRSNALKRWGSKMPPASQPDATPYPYTRDIPDGISPPIPPTGDLLGDTPATPRASGVKPSPRAKPQVVDEPEGFAAWWAGWKPHLMPKGSRQDALKAYRKATQTGGTPDELTRQRDAYLAQCRATDCKSKHASSWLNGRGWLEVYEAHDLGACPGSPAEPYAGTRHRTGQRPEPPSLVRAAQRAKDLLRGGISREPDGVAGPLDGDDLGF